jgi:hypothetical protein
LEELRWNAHFFPYNFIDHCLYESSLVVAESGSIDRPALYRLNVLKESNDCASASRMTSCDPIDLSTEF